VVKVRGIAALSLALAIVAASATPALAASKSFYVDPYSQSNIAAKKDARLAGLAAIPQGKWFTDWTTISSIENDVSSYVNAADAAGKIPLVVLYQIPDRDCGGYSSGGLSTASDYRAWIDGAAAGLRGSNAWVVVEPDALAQSCGDSPERTGEIGYASKTLAAAGARVYLDAGNSQWGAPSTMAKRLVDAGVQYARGFSTNVANFRPTAAEKAYAASVNTQLAALGVSGKHYVIDTGRNGAKAGALAADDVFNPPAARVGTQPTLFSTGALDAYLWIKTVGETDGPYNGGPASGFSTKLALALISEQVPPKPSAPKAKATSKTVAVTWKKVPGATVYRVVFTPRHGTAITKHASKAKYTLNKIKRHTRYTITVAAGNPAGYSTSSTAKKVTTS
jgi:endoglucanase